MKKASCFLLLIFTLIIISCSKERLSLDKVTEEVIEDDIRSETPCDFDLSDVAANSTVVIGCILDLEGKTVNLPENVTLSFDGGDIIGGGTLNFSSGGKIAGQLLNSKIELKGAVTLIDPTFKFVPSRWEIVEGTVSQEEAFNNHLVIQKVIDLVKNIGVLDGNGQTIFQIGEIDAYFDSVEKQIPVAELPSNFHFKMSENTNLRVFPVNKAYSSWMIRIRNQKNTNVSGGNIIGERTEHGPTESKSGVLVWIMSGVDITIDNVNISYASGTGLTINSYLFADNPAYEPSKNVVITGCTFDSNRANNLSITDGTDIIIENSKFYRAGIDIGNSLGSAPRISVVIEPVQGQKVEGVIIRNNILKEGGGKSSILAALGNDIIISGNEADLQVGWTSASNVKVIDNPALRGGVIGGFRDDFALSKSMNNVISGNTIIGSNTGIYATNDDIKIFNNDIIDCIVAVQMKGLKDSEIYDNTITSTVEASFGFNAQISLDNVIIRNNNIKVNGRPFSMTDINYEDTYANNKFIFKENKFECTNNGTFTRVNGIEILDNSFLKSGVAIADSENIIFNRNTIKSDSNYCLLLGKTNSIKNIDIIDNVLENTNEERFGGYGFRMNASGNNLINENSDIILKDNEIKVVGSNYGIHAKGIDGVTISDNIGSVENYQFIYFRGNNSKITNNDIITGVAGIDIEGNNNTVSGN